jgi:hypothetical protein
MIDKWEGLARKPSWHNRDTILAFTLNEWGELRRTSGRIAGVPVSRFEHSTSEYEYRELSLRQPAGPKHF